MPASSPSTPAPERPCVLTINGGSSSIKFALFETGASLRRRLEGKIERIGLPDSVFKSKGNGAEENFSRKISVPDHKAAVRLLMDWLSERLGRGQLTGAGHRVVHGGPKYREAQKMSPEMLGELHELIPFDPHHLPQEIMLAEAFFEHFPSLAQVACFDTAFHRTMPRVAKLLPIPRRFDAKGIQRYGFHGISYEFLMQELARQAGPELAGGKVVLAHLGNGASLAAVRGGQSMDTTMALTPTAGVPMSTRSGDLDPGLVWYLARVEGIGPEQFNDLANFQSGLLGVSEISSDMRDLLERESSDVRAAEAIALFCYQIKKTIGSFAAALGGLDALVFAGGIGENAPAVREQICRGLEFFGILIDVERNARGAGVISTDSSRVSVRVIPTDEEWMIARTTCRILGVEGGGGFGASDGH